MTTTAQAAANVANAQHSTGPRSEEGKERSSRNAVKHGLTAKHLLILPGEEEEFAELRDSLLAELAPEGAIEMTFFEQFVHAAWNIRRFRILERELMAYGAESILDEKYGKALDRLNRYAGSAQRAHVRALKELRTLQTNRVLTTTLKGETAGSIPTLASIKELTKRTQPAPRGGRNSLHPIVVALDEIVTRILQNEPDDRRPPRRGAA